jgi:hypothetical protein
MKLLAFVLFFVLLGQSVRAQQPSWEDIAMQAERNAASAQVLSSAVISALQDEIAALKAQLAKLQAKPPEPSPEPPK